MYIISSFDHSIYVELALSEMQQMGIEKAKIMAVPLNLFAREVRVFDTISQSDGVSLFDTAPAMAAAITVISSSYGFILPGGPIIWGLIGAAVGLIIGFTIDFIKKPKNENAVDKKKKLSEIFILIQCDEAQIDWIKKLLKSHYALSFAVINDLKYEA